MGVAKMPPAPFKAGKDTRLKIRTAWMPPLPFKAGGWGGEMAWEGYMMGVVWKAVDKGEGKRYF